MKASTRAKRLFLDYQADRTAILESTDVRHITPIITDALEVTDKSLASLPGLYITFSQLEADMA
jgi:hypothetical protein